MLSASKNPRTTRHVSSRRPAAEGCGSALLRPLPKTAARWPLCGVQAHPSALPSLYLTLGAARWPCRAALPREASRNRKTAADAELVDAFLPKIEERPDAADSRVSECLVCCWPFAPSNQVYGNCFQGHAQVSTLHAGAVASLRK